ncbi:type VII secretion integral membrane protein EccD [Mycobacterium sp. RTGN5]|uniref:type VII secretion integral membrane protein EccD n=1 Tax=Mycobacterium sp. RTGN5 TaxID=3016522 RepID=UPI0029C9A22B|nr:type VII secretion integral membrane protein EccD [Mycobacterium sp. RTGN5]
MAATDEMCQVSIRTADHEVDVTLPAQVPIAELMPAVVDLIGKDEFAGREPRLTRVSGEVLNTAATLAQSAIPDGELLILTSAAVRPVPVPRFDAGTAVVDAVAGLIHPSWPAAGRRAGWIVLCWASAVLLVLLGFATLNANAPRHAAIGAAATALALAGAVAVRRDRALASTLGVLAAALAGLTAALASPVHAGLASFLLAMSAGSATSLLAWRLLDCAAVVFLPLAAATMAASAATVGAVAGWWPTTAAGPMVVTASLATLAVSARLSVHSAGLSTADLSGTDLEVRTRTAHDRLTALVMTAAAGAPLGAVVTAATAVRPGVAAGFIAVVCSALLLRAYRQSDPYHHVALVISFGIAMTTLIVLCAIKSPVNTPWLCGGLVAVGAGAVRFRHGGRWRLPPSVRGAITVLDLAVSAAVVPSAAVAAGAFAALPGIGQP